MTRARRAMAAGVVAASGVLAMSGVALGQAEYEMHVQHFDFNPKCGVGIGFPQGLCVGGGGLDGTTGTSTPSPAPISGSWWSDTSNGRYMKVTGECSAPDTFLWCRGYHARCSGPAAGQPTEFTGYFKWRAPDLEFTDTDTQSGRTSISVRLSARVLSSVFSSTGPCPNGVGWDCAEGEDPQPSASFQVDSDIGLSLLDVVPSGAGTWQEFVGPVASGVLLGTATQWEVEGWAFIDVSFGGCVGVMEARPTLRVVLGDEQPDGRIGPVFEFPDCPTCTANAPSIGLVDNYFEAPGCVGDINGDGGTDVFDFGEFVSQFGNVVVQTAFDPAADLNKDGVIDVFDFGLFATDFGCSE